MTPVARFAKGALVRIASPDRVDNGYVGTVANVAFLSWGVDYTVDLGARPRVSRFVFVREADLDAGAPT